MKNSKNSPPITGIESNDHRKIEVLIQEVFYEIKVTQWCCTNLKQLHDNGHLVIEFPEYDYKDGSCFDRIYYQKQTEDVCFWLKTQSSDKTNYRYKINSCPFCKQTILVDYQVNQTGKLNYPLEDESTFLVAYESLYRKYTLECRQKSFLKAAQESIQKKYDDLMAKNKTLNEEYYSLSNKIDNLTDEIQELKAENKALNHD